MTATSLRTDIAEECPLCAEPVQTRTPEVYDPISGEKFSIVSCQGCGVGMTSPAPRRLDAYYRERYYGNRHSFTDRLCNWRRRRMVAQQTSPREGARLLDVGCGDGSFLDAASRAGWNTVGVEPHNGTFRGNHAVFRSLEEAGSLAPFECVTMWHVLEHVPDPVETLTQIHSILSSDGVLVLAVPDFGGLQASFFGRHWLHLDVPRHLYHFTPRSLACLLDSTGFEVVRTAHQELEYDLFGWVQSSLNTFSGTPNVLFDALTGKPRRVSRLGVGMSYLAGSMIGVAALGLTAASTLLRRGGTVIAAARRRPR